MARKLDQSPPALRAFSLLETVARADEPLTLRQITQATHLPKPSVHRMMVLLGSSGLVAREPGGRRYTVGHRLSAFGVQVVVNSSFRAARHVILQALVDEIGETCNFTMLDGAQVLFLDRVEPDAPLRMNLHTGSRVPLHCTASGKLLLAMLPKVKRERLIASLPLRRHTAKTIVDQRRLERELQQIRSQHYSTDDEEAYPGLISVAVPVRDGVGRTCATLAVHAPISRTLLTCKHEHLPVLRRAAEQMACTFMDRP